MDAIDAKPHSATAGFTQCKDAKHVGAVFVHGIGSQASGDTLRTWSLPIARAVAELRRKAGLAANPVVRNEAGSTDRASRVIELELPAADGTTQHWVLIEAWWANRLAAPDFNTMVRWLGQGGALARIATSSRLFKRLVERQNGGPPVRTYRDPAKSLAKLPPESAWMKRTYESSNVMRVYINAFWRLRRRVRARNLRRARRSENDAVEVVVSTISGFTLVVFAGIRALTRLIPIPGVRDAAVIAAADYLVSDWFGDIELLLSDHPQSAAVKQSLEDAVKQLRDQNCATAAIIAHSGGAIVSWLALAGSTRQTRAPVELLVTLGQGLNLGRELASSADDLGRFREPLGLAWDDYWSTEDPAPVGPVKLDRQLAAPSIEEHEVWNLLSVRDDHGAYWENDEEFVLPVLQSLGRLGGTKASGFYGEPAQQTLLERRVSQRHQRVALRAMWTKLCAVGPAVAVLAGVAFAGDVKLLGDSLATGWDFIPGHELVSGPLTALRDLGSAPDFAPFAAPAIAAGQIILWVGVGVWGLMAALGFVGKYASYTSSRRVRWLFEIADALPLVLLLLFGSLAFVKSGIATEQTLGILSIGATALIYLWLGMTLAVGSLSAYPRLIFTISTLTTLIWAAAWLTPMAAILLDASVGATVLGVVAIGACFGVLQRIGLVRWSGWDSEERALVRSYYDGEFDRRDVSWQAALLLSAFALLVATVATSSARLGLAAVGVGLASVMLGVARDALTANRLRRQRARLRPRGSTLAGSSTPEPFVVVADDSKADANPSAGDTSQDGNVTGPA
jgi:hypothetical protein